MVSYSIARGHGTPGIGDGPGQPAVGADQYLWADPELWRDPALAEALRPWLTLDFTAHFDFELRDFEEGWSAFAMAAYFFVARHTLISGSKYVTHARAWKTEALPPDYDPGAFLGRSALFERR